MYLIAKKMIDNNKKWAKSGVLGKFSKFNSLYNYVSKLYKIWH